MQLLQCGWSIATKNSIEIIVDELIQKKQLPIEIWTTAVTRVGLLPRAADSPSRCQAPEPPHLRDWSAVNININHQQNHHHYHHHHVIFGPFHILPFTLFILLLLHFANWNRKANDSSTDTNIEKLSTFVTNLFLDLQLFFSLKLSICKIFNIMHWFLPSKI